MNKSIKKNYFYNLIYQIFVMVIPLITTPYLSRIMGATNIGIYSYTYSIVTYFILFGSLGISTYARREIAYVQDDIEKRSKVFWEIFILKTITLSISICIYYFCFAINNEYSLYYKILLLEILANIFDISWFFQGLENFKKVVLRNIFVKTVLTILIFLLVQKSSDLWKYFLIYTFSTLLGNISFWIGIKKYICKCKEKLEIKRHIKPSIMLLLPQISIQIYTILDKVMLGSMIEDKSEVGYYEQASKIVRLGITVVTTLSVVLSTRIASIYSSGNTKEIKNKIYKSFKFVWLLGFPIMMGFIISADNFVPWFYGDGYEKVISLIKIFSPIVIFVGMADVIGSQYLIPTLKQNKYTIAVTVSAITNVILNLILIPNLLAVGSTISSVISELIGMLIQLYFVRKELNIYKIFKSTKKYLIASIIMSFILGSFSKKLSPSIINTSIIVISGGIIYVIALLIMKEEFVCQAIKSITNRKRKGDFYERTNKKNIL